MQSVFDSQQDPLASFGEVAASVLPTTSDSAYKIEGEAPLLRRTFASDAWPEAIALHITFVAERDVPIVVDASPFYLWLNDPLQPACICQSLLGNVMAQNAQMRVRVGETNELRMTCEAGRVEVTLNDQSLVFESPYAPSFAHLAIQWSGETRVTISHLELATRRAKVADSPVPPPGFSWQMTFDLFDDLIPAPCSRDTLDEMMVRLARQGYEQVNWIYHGSSHDGFWDSTGDKARPDDHVAQTFAQLGDDDLKAAVQAAHKAGMRIHAVIKPFDLSICGYNFPHGSPLAEQYGKNEVLGGKAYLCFNAAAEHPELCMRRRQPISSAPSAVSRIMIQPRDATAATVKTLELWVSDDNWHYRQHQEAFRVRSDEGRIVIDDLNLRNPFIAIRVAGHEGYNRVHHSLRELVRLFDEHGCKIPFTYGLHPRSYWQRGDASSPHLERTYDSGLGFSREGFFFDSLRAGIPSSLWNSAKSRYHEVALDNALGLLGIAIGKNAFVPGVFCPSEPEARALWQKFILQALDCGVDGVNIRVSNHSDVIEWDEYGFNEPMVTAYRREFGVDVTGEEFSREQWRRLRGRYFTRFLTETKAVVKDRDKAFALHISDVMQGSPAAPTAMNIHWDWLAWIEQLKPDQVTVKLIGDQNVHTHHARQIVLACSRRGIPAIVCPFVHSVQQRVDGDWSAYIAGLRSAGFSGFDVYEHASCYVNHPDGRTETLLDLSPHVRSALNQHRNPAMTGSKVSEGLAS